MQCLLPWAEVVMLMHASPAPSLMEQHLFTQPQPSTLCLLSGKTVTAWIKSFHSTLKDDIGCGSGVSCMQLHPGGWGRVGWARRSFSLPCFRLAHILRQPSAPIHPLDPILLGLKEYKSQRASTHYHQHIAVAQSISEHLVHQWFPLFKLFEMRQH